MMRSMAKTRPPPDLPGDAGRLAGLYEEKPVQKIPVQGFIRTLPSREGIHPAGEDRFQTVTG